LRVHRHSLPPNTASRREMVGGRRGFLHIPVLSRTAVPLGKHQQLPQPQPIPFLPLSFLCQPRDIFRLPHSVQTQNSFQPENQHPIPHIPMVGGTIHWYIRRERRKTRLATREFAKAMDERDVRDRMLMPHSVQTQNSFQPENQHPIPHIPLVHRLCKLPRCESGLSRAMSRRLDRSAVSTAFPRFPRCYRGHSYGRGHDPLVYPPRTAQNPTRNEGA
jgi:hypothetical protein